jgi:plasmid stability protein
MGTVTIRNLDERLITAIKRHAAANDVSMEEEIRRLLASTYDEDRRAHGRAWARRQLERLQRGELPKADISAVEEIRRMRDERDEQLAPSRPRRGDHR